MHPDSFSSGSYDTRSPQISQVPADFGLVRLQYLHEETNADLLIPDQVDDPQSRRICQCAKKQLAIEWFLFPRHNVPNNNTKHICLDIYLLLPDNAKHARAHICEILMKE